MTMRITEGMTRRTVLQDLGASKGRLTQMQREISSGHRITRPADDPFGAGRTLQLSGELEGFKQFKSNVDDGIGWVTATETALTRITDTVQRARELLVQGGNDSNGQVAREGIEKQRLLDLAHERGVELDEGRARRAVAAGHGALLEERLERE